jgi:hypothetical protein
LFSFGFWWSVPEATKQGSAYTPRWAAPCRCHTSMRGVWAGPLNCILSQHFPFSFFFFFPFSNFEFLKKENFKTWTFYKLIVLIFNFKNLNIFRKPKNFFEFALFKICVFRIWTIFKSKHFQNFNFFNHKQLERRKI